MRQNLFCSNECQQRGEKDSAPLTKLFFCLNSISNCLGGEKECNRNNILEAVESLKAIEQRLRVICGAFGREIDSFIGVEECALVLVSLMSCSWHWGQFDDAKKRANEATDLEPSEEGRVDVHIGAYCTPESEKLLPGTRVPTCVFRTNSISVLDLKYTKRNLLLAVGNYAA